MNIEISGIPVEIIKKNIKNIHIYILPPDGRVRVTAPKRLSVENIRTSVGARIEWIRNKREKFLGQPSLAVQIYVTGEEMYVLGRPYIIELRYVKRGKSLVIDGDRAVLTMREDSTPAEREAYINEWYREILKAEIEEYLPKWVGITGLHPSGWQVKNMKTRWGTCNTRTGKIWLNLQLAKKPAEYLEYVILHELAHLRVRNHGKDFCVILDRYMPGWREIKKKLNGMG